MRNKKGQVTIFIIIAIIIVAIALIFFWNRISIVFTGSENPEASLKTCIEEPLRENLGKMMMQGGSLAPEDYYLYQNYSVEYLCYTNEYYKPCVMQKPFLIDSAQNELKKSVSRDIDRCVDDFREEMEAKGYDASVGEPEVNIEIVPEKIMITINSQVRLEKGEEKQEFSRFLINIPSQYYNLLSISSSILNWEARYGDSDPLSYMMLYPGLKIEKYKQGDATKIYILTQKRSNEVFMFASRSYAWPAGWGIGELHER